MKRFNYILAICTIILVFLSCNKDDFSATNVKNKPSNFLLPDSVILNIDNGCLAFEDESKLQICINFLNTLTLEDLNEFESTIGFISYRA